MRKLIQSNYNTHITFMILATRVMPEGTAWTGEDLPRLMLTCILALVGVYYGWLSVK